MAMTINDPAIGTRKLTDEELTDLIGTPEEFVRDMEEFGCTLRFLRSEPVRQQYGGRYVAALRSEILVDAASMESLREKIWAAGLPWERIVIREIPAL